MAIVLNYSSLYGCNADYRLPKLDKEREELGRTIGNDGFALLDAIYDWATPEWLRQIPAVETLRRVWRQQFYAPTEDGSVQWRLPKDMPPSTLAIHSSYDLEAHYSSKVVLIGSVTKFTSLKLVTRIVRTSLLKYIPHYQQYLMMQSLNLSIKAYP